VARQPVQRVQPLQLGLVLRQLLTMTTVMATTTTATRE
jgi:hypothetical protein